MNAEHEVQNEFPEQLDHWATLDFEAISNPQPTTPVHNDVAVLPEETGENHQLVELEPLSFDDDEDAPITIQTGERPFQKRPLPQIALGVVCAASLAVGIGLFISAGSKDASRVFAENSSKTQVDAVPSDIPAQDPKDQTIGQLRSDQASQTLKEKIDALNKRKEQDAKQKANLANRTIPSERVASIPVQSSYSSLPPVSNPDPVPFRSIPRDPVPSYTPAYRPASSIQNYEPPVQTQQPKQPKVQPKLLAFGALPEEKGATQSSAMVQPVAGPEQTAGYQPAAYTTQTQGFDTQGNTALDTQQQSFLGGGRLTRIAVNASAGGTITSGAILPGRFSVQIGAPLSGIPAGTTMLFETKTVYPNGKLEAYAIGVVSGDYQRVQPVPAGAIALLSGDGNLLKAQKPGAGFMSSIMGRGLFGAVQGAAGRFLSTDSVISQSNSGTLLSQSAGGKGFSDLAAGALQGGLSPLLQSLPQQQTTDDKSFSLEPGKKVTVKVIQPFNFSF